MSEIKELLLLILKTQQPSLFQDWFCWKESLVCFYGKRNHYEKQTWGYN